MMLSVAIITVHYFQYRPTLLVITTRNKRRIQASRKIATGYKLVKERDNHHKRNILMAINVHYNSIQIVPCMRKGLVCVYIVGIHVKRIVMSCFM